jgi:hypothetical protein
MAAASEASIRAQIEFRAYEGFFARGGAHGSDPADWFKAERELNVRAAMCLIDRCVNVTAFRSHHAD